MAKGGNRPAGVVQKEAARLAAPLRIENESDGKNRTLIEANLTGPMTEPLALEILMAISAQQAAHEELNDFPGKHPPIYTPGDQRALGRPGDPRPLTDRVINCPCPLAARIRELETTSNTMRARVFLTTRPEEPEEPE